VDPNAVSIRVLKGKDEKLIAEMTYDNAAKKLMAVLKNVLNGIDPGQLTLGDEKFIMLWLAANSYTRTVPIETTCGMCLQKISIDIDLNKDLKSVSLPDNFTEPYPVILSDGSTVHVRLLRADDEAKIIEYEKTNESSWIYRYAMTIVDDKKNIMDKMLMLSEMGSEDFVLIRTVPEKFNHGPIMEAPYECAKCGFKGATAVPFRFDVLFPFGDALTKAFGARV